MKSNRDQLNAKTECRFTVAVVSLECEQQFGGGHPSDQDGHDWNNRHSDIPSKPHPGGHISLERNGGRRPESDNLAESRSVEEHFEFER